MKIFGTCSIPLNKHKGELPTGEIVFVCVGGQHSCRVISTIHVYICFNNSYNQLKERKSCCSDNWFQLILMLGIEVPISGCSQVLINSINCWGERPRLAHTLAKVYAISTYTMYIS